jgi:hypothetical protein
VEEFGASGLAWRRIEEGIIVEKLRKHLVNAAPEPCLYNIYLTRSYGCPGNCRGNYNGEDRVDDGF